MIHINVTRYDRVSILRFDCIHCEKSRFFVVASQEWYGRIGTCLKCGEQFGDDEWLARPFARGWRKENIANAKKVFRQRKGIASDQKAANTAVMFTIGQKVVVTGDEHGILTGQDLEPVRGKTGVVESQMDEKGAFWWVKIEGDLYLCYNKEIKAV